MSKIESFSERSLFLENYSAPLHVLTIDAAIESAEDINKILSQIFLLPKKQIMDYSNWISISRKVIRILADDNFSQWINKYLLFDIKEIRKREAEKIDANKQELIRTLSRINEDSSLFGYLALRNTIYLVSEGSLIFDAYETGEDNITILPIIKQLAFNRLVSKNEISQDMFSYWLKTTNLLLQPVSMDFKDEFNKLLDYSVPFGLSPKTDSETLNNLISHAKYIAIYPLMQGISEVGNAILTHQWGIAIKAAATTGGVVILIMTSIAITDRISRWIRSKEKNKNETE